MLKCWKMLVLNPTGNQIDNALSFLSATQEIRDHALSPRFSRQLAAAHRVSGHPFIDDIKHLTP
jgi:hypothetical protein